MDAQLPSGGDLLCPQCGYNLRGLPEHRCPECGTPFDPAKLTASAIPWVHRCRLGRLRGFWHTVVMVTFRPKMLSREFAHPVSYSDSQRFRWTVVALVYLPVLIATISAYGLGEGTPLDGLFVFKTFDAWAVFGVHLAAILAAAVATGVPSYFFHPRSLPIEQQNRGIALSYYASAPLAWTPALFILDWMVLVIPSNTVFAVVTLILILFPLITWWRNLYLLARDGMARGPGGLVLTGVVAPLTCLVSTGLAYVGVHSVVWFLGLVYYSLKD